MDEEIFAPFEEEALDKQLDEVDEKGQAHDGGADGMCDQLRKDKPMEEKGLQVRGIVMPAVTAEEAVKAFDAYQDLAHRIMRPEDVQKIQGKDFKKKSFWRKCQRFFNLSIEIISEFREEHNGYFVYKFVVRATAPNGAHCDGTGSCSSNEKGISKTEHNTRAIAETRAKNRAIADLVAFGEVSAEEVDASNGNGEESHIPDDGSIADIVKPQYKISDKQRKLVYARWKAKNIPDDVMKDYLKDTYGIDSTADILKDWLDAVLEYIEHYKG